MGKQVVRLLTDRIFSNDGTGNNDCRPITLKAGTLCVVIDSVGDTIYVTPFPEDRPHIWRGFVRPCPTIEYLNEMEVLAWAASSKA